MKKILVLYGSRADKGLLETIADKLRSEFEVLFQDKYQNDVDLILVLGDRHEILRSVLQAHLDRVPIAHIAGGDVTEGSYDDAMRDCISRMATFHFPTSYESMARLISLGYKNVHMVGNPAWETINPERHMMLNYDYVVINYQPETIDGTNEIRELLASLDNRPRVIFLPNPDNGSDEITHIIETTQHPEGSIIIDSCTREHYLNYLYFCDELIGNSSSMLYEAPVLGVKTRMIGKRQRGRVFPVNGIKTSEVILNVLRMFL